MPHLAPSRALLCAECVCSAGFDGSIDGVQRCRSDRSDCPNAAATQAGGQLRSEWSDATT